MNSVATIRNPKLILVSESPALQRSLHFAVHLAKHLTAEVDRVFLIDLTLAGSRLPEAIQACGEVVRPFMSEPQPLWQLTSSGRGFRPFSAVDQKITVVAQGAGTYPTLDQIPRIYEQLIRFIAQSRNALEASLEPVAIDDVSGDRAESEIYILTSEIGGIPLDAPCWMTADHAILFADEQIPAHHVMSGIKSRLPKRLPDQQITFVRTQSERRWLTWPTKNGITSIDTSEQRGYGEYQSDHHIHLRWPFAHPRLGRSMAGIASTIWQQIQQRNCVEEIVTTEQPRRDSESHVA